LAHFWRTKLEKAHKNRKKLFKAKCRKAIIRTCGDLAEIRKSPFRRSHCGGCEFESHMLHQT